MPAWTWLCDVSSEANPEPLMVTITTEHYTLSGARSQTIYEANGRASVFLAAPSSGLIALGSLRAIGYLDQPPAGRGGRGAGRWR